MLNGEVHDFGELGCRLVEVDSAQTQGEWGRFKYATLPPHPLGWSVSEARTFLAIAFPDPVLTPITSHAGGVSSELGAAWTMEWQARASAGAIRFYLNSGADAGFDAPENNMISLFASWSTGSCDLHWNNRGGTTAAVTTTDVVKKDNWQHFCMMKSAGSDQLVGYVDGVLHNRLTPTDPPRTLTKVQILHHSFSADADVIVIREFSLRAIAAYPTIPFTPAADVTFAPLIGNSQLRWVSHML